MKKTDKQTHKQIHPSIQKIHTYIQTNKLILNFNFEISQIKSLFYSTLAPVCFLLAILEFCRAQWISSSPTASLFTLSFCRPLILHSRGRINPIFQIPSPALLSAFAQLLPSNTADNRERYAAHGAFG